MTSRQGLKERIKNHRLLFVILTTAILTHLVFLIPILDDTSRLFVCSDSVNFEKISCNILKGNGYTLASQNPYSPNSTMVPGYPLFITGLYGIFGEKPYLIVALQIVLSVIIILFAFHLTKEKYSYKTALICGVLLIPNLCLAFYSVQLMADILFLCLMMPAFIFTLWIVDGRSPVKSGLGAGFFFGTATMVKPVSLYFPLLLPLLLLIPGNKKPMSSRLAGLGALLLIHVVMISPWFIRNKIEFGHFFFSTVQSFNLSHIHAAPIKAAIEDKDIDQAERELKQQAFARYGQPENEAELYLYAGKQALRYILHRPVRYSKLYFSGITKTILPMGFAEFLLFYSKTPPKIRNLTVVIHTKIIQGKISEAVQVIWQERIAPTGGMFFVYIGGFMLNLFIIGLALRGFLIGGFSKPLNFLTFLVGVYFIGVTGPAGQPRHFLPLLPLAAILASHALVSGMSKGQTALET
jgi:4-amino-4-deoxy-L-arabinose transferase-like glycosyltransferase